MTIPVFYFTSGIPPTSGEASDISALRAAAYPMTIQVQNGATIISNGENFSPPVGSTLVGAIPALYSGAYSSSTVSSLVSGGSGASISSFQPCYIAQGGYASGYDAPAPGAYDSQAPMGYDSGTNACFIMGANVSPLPSDKLPGIWLREDHSIVAAGDPGNVFDVNGNEIDQGVFAFTVDQNNGILMSANVACVVAIDGSTCPASGLGTTATFHVNSGGTLSVTLS
jgi:hypothetical protein